MDVQVFNFAVGTTRFDCVRGNLSCTTYPEGARKRGARQTCASIHVTLYLLLSLHTFVFLPTAAADPTRSSQTDVASARLTLRLLCE